MVMDTSFYVMVVNLSPLQPCCKIRTARATSMSFFFNNTAVTKELYRKSPLYSRQLPILTSFEKKLSVSMKVKVYSCQIVTIISTHFLKVNGKTRGSAMAGMVLFSYIVLCISFIIFFY